MDTQKQPITKPAPGEMRELGMRAGAEARLNDGKRLIRNAKPLNKIERDWPLDESLIAHAARIEDAMLKAGAKPGEDYTYRDLFNMAVQFPSARVGH